MMMISRSYLPRSEAIGSPGGNRAEISTAFLKSPKALLIDQLARRYNQRPSSLLDLDDPWEALDFDMGIMVRGFRQDKVDHARENRPGRKGKGKPISLEAFKAKMGARGGR